MNETVNRKKNTNVELLEIRDEGEYSVLHSLEEDLLSNQTKDL